MNIDKLTNIFIGFVKDYKKSMVILTESVKQLEDMSEEISRLRSELKEKGDE